MRSASFVVVLVLPAVAAAQPVVPPAAPYREAVARLEAVIAREVADKKLPALSVALVDDQRVVWANGYGFRDRRGREPATAETVYRVGSVSKLFTDLAVMQLVEAGTLDLDAPVTTYLPDFQPAAQPGHKPITLRMLMSHRAGLVREPPVGNYFDPTEPGLEKTVASLNGVPLVYPPGERMKYSNAGVAVVGAALQKTQNQPFERYLQAKVLDPLGMESSSFGKSPAAAAKLADAVMWTYHGREFPAPTFELGEGPAGCLYSSVLDLAKFASCLFAGGKPLLKAETLAGMLKPQFAAAGEARGFGVGFHLREFEGRQRAGHGGAVYGFATEFAVLPADKLGVVVVCSRDVANAVTTRLADDALRLMLAAKAGKPLPDLPKTEQLPAADARKAAGRYAGPDGRWLELTEDSGTLHAETDRGGMRVRVRKAGDDLFVDDVHGWGPRLRRVGDGFAIGANEYRPAEPPAAAPAPPPDRWRGLIGEYGWDHSTLVVFERDGRLHALIEWVEIDPLTEESENVFAFPADAGMYHGEKLVFTRDAAGRATKVEAARVVFARRKLDGENGETFRVAPRRPLAELRKEALAAAPPAAAAGLLKPDLVDLTAVDPAIKLDVRYATDNNFLSTPFYTSPQAFMQRPAAEAVGRASKAVGGKGYGLVIFDAYRPWHVTKMFWDATPDRFRNFVADPLRGSRHNRGCAVDLGLYDRATGRVAEAVSGYDEFSDRAYPNYVGGTSRQRWHRDLLRRAMEAEGFRVFAEEWWHFDHKDWRLYPVLNKTFEELK